LAVKKFDLNFVIKFFSTLIVQISGETLTLSLTFPIILELFILFWNILTSYLSTFEFLMSIDRHRNDECFLLKNQRSM
jgi:hypothetical protein